MDPKFIEAVSQRCIDVTQPEQMQIEQLYKELKRLTFMRAVETAFIKYKFKILRPLRQAKNDARVVVRDPSNRSTLNVAAHDAAVIKYSSTKDMLDSWYLSIRMGTPSRDFMEFVKRIHFQRLARDKLKILLGEHEKSWRVLNGIPEPKSSTKEDIERSYDVPVVAGIKGNHGKKSSRRKKGGKKSNK